MDDNVKAELIKLYLSLKPVHTVHTHSKVNYF